MLPRGASTLQVGPELAVEEHISLLPSHFPVM